MSESRIYIRPSLDRTGPDRGPGNYYRASSDDERHAATGVRLNSTETALLDSVRMAYRVAEAQIERSGRLARRLRDTGDKLAGPDSDRQALDATERLVFKAMMTGLGWLENAAAGGGNPFQRLVAAEYRLLGSLLGIAPARASKTSGKSDSGDAMRDEEVPPGAAAQGDQEPRLPLRIKLGGEKPRAVKVRRWHYTGKVPYASKTICFYRAGRGRTSVEGNFSVTRRQGPELAILTSARTAMGLYVAAICDDDKVQVGSIEIEI